VNGHAAPIASLIAKSEKARQKLASGTWQHTMLGENLDALRIAALRAGQALIRDAGDDPGTSPAR
jgi:hypothetical protein